MRTMGELEAVVMQVLWSAENPKTVREVLGEIDRHPPLAYTTVLTVMDNLRRKGFLTRERVGRAHAYRPAKAQADYTADLMDELLADSGDRSATLLRFVDRMTPSEVSRLREALDD
ncbi:MAG TPA: BlaI/MecI/CopY family transcriptional regulator [Marmoricola sp.]|jgi:predicted transcriptional regulator